MRKTEAGSSSCLTARSLFFVLSGPSGVGKDAVLARLKQSGYPLEYIVTVTTRPRRAKERDNIDYHFISVDEFEAMIERKELLEWARVYGNCYGVPRKPVEQALAGGRDAMVKVDVQGAATIRKAINWHCQRQGIQRRGNLGISYHLDDFCRRVKKGRSGPHCTIRPIVAFTPPTFTG